MFKNGNITYLSNERKYKVDNHHPFLKKRNSVGTAFYGTHCIKPRSTRSQNDICWFDGSRRVLVIKICRRSKLFMYCCPGTTTTQAESIHSNLRRGLERRFTTHITLNTEQNQLANKVSADS